MSKFSVVSLAAKIPTEAAAYEYVEMRFGASIRHDGDMGSADDKPRKRRHPLAKVPKYEEPNTLSLPGLTGESGMAQPSGRFGHGSDGKEHHRPGLVGRAFLKVLGMRQRHPDDEHTVTREHEDKAES